MNPVLNQCADGSWCCVPYNYYITGTLQNTTCCSLGQGQQLADTTLSSSAAPASGKNNSAKKVGLGAGLGLGIPLVLVLAGIGVFACWTIARRRDTARATAPAAAEESHLSAQKPPQYPQASPAVAQQPVYYVVQQPAVQGGYPAELPGTKSSG
jgi:hypothetical protein